MTKNKIKSGIVVLFFIGLLALTAIFMESNYQDISETRNLTGLEDIKINYSGPNIENRDISVYLADNEDLRQKGLMNVKEMEKDGMIFVYEEADTRKFWMRNTYLPLYIYFLNEDGSTLNREFAKVPEEPESVTGGENHTYESIGDAKYVLEIRKEVVERKEIGEEAVFDISQFR